LDEWPYSIPFGGAFTARAPGRSLRLISEVEVFPAFAAGAPPTQGKKYMALYDTGATHTAISPQIVQDLNLPSIGARTVGVGGGFLSTTSHLVNIRLPNNVTIAMVAVAKMVIPSGENVLIGMDILGMGDFAVTHFGGKTVFSFCIPSRKCIDFAAEIQANRPPTASPTVPRVGRNAPCPCGSGKKYKACHGRHF
jgi:predicted aspartyl protease